MDIERCFPSIVPTMVRAIFDGLGFGPEAAGLLTKLTTYNNELPQGVPTSTALANLVLLRVDWRVMKLQEQHHFNYSRWVDDLTFSGSFRLLKLRRLLRRIIDDEGFKEGKTVTMLANDRQTVTNFVVNNKVNLSREKRVEIRREALEARNSSNASLSPSIAGKLFWYRAVNPGSGGRLVKRLLGK
jgi:RNA-directed DNA polymerase